MAQNCESLTQLKQKCYELHGEKSEKCMIATLEEKRCRSFAHCFIEAKAYYGTPVGDAAGEKAICASWEESYCFGNPRIMRVDSKSSSDERDKVFVHHQNAKYKIQNNKGKLRACQDVSDALSRCLRNNIPA